MRPQKLAFALWLFSASAAAGQAPQPDGAGLERGTLPESWAESPDACATRQSDFRLHEYNPDFYILRQSGCTNYEKPFLYLIFGDGQALLVDTGARGARVADAVGAALKRWADAHGKPIPRLVAAHSHAHGDHVAGDSALAVMPGVTVVGTSPEAVQRFFGLKARFVATFDPADASSTSFRFRTRAASIAIYDRRTQDPRPATRCTRPPLVAGRVREARGGSSISPETFSGSRPRRPHRGGAHAVPDYPIGEVSSPTSKLERRGHLLELNAALEQMGPTIVGARYRFHDLAEVTAT